MLCHDKIYLTPPEALQYSNDPNHLQSVLYSPLFILSYRRLIPSPLPLPKNSSRPPPLTDKLLTGTEIHKSDVTFSAVGNLETLTIRQFVLIFSYLDTNINEANHTIKLKLLFTVYICRQNGVSFLIVLRFP